MNPAVQPDLFEAVPWAVIRNRAAITGATFGILTALIGAALSVLWAWLGGAL